jgi:hypothetical protein
MCLLFSISDITPGGFWRRVLRENGVFGRRTVVFRHGAHNVLDHRTLCIFRDVVQFRRDMDCRPIALGLTQTFIRAAL